MKVKTETEQKKIEIVAPDADKQADKPSLWPQSPPIDEFTKAIAGETPKLEQGAKPAPVPPEEQKKQMAEAEKIAYLRVIARNSEKALTGTIENADVGTGGISYLLFGVSYAMFDGGSYLVGTMLFFVSAFLAVVKNRLPEGPLARWLRKGQILQDITYTLSGKRRG